MRIHAMRAAVLAAGCAMVLALAANGCTQSSGPASADKATEGAQGKDGRPGVAASPTADEGASGGRGGGAGADDDRTFLARGECATGNRQRVEEVGCDTERAAARVLARHEGSPAKGPRCPERTDFVLHITERLPDADEDGDGAVPRGYACMRSLEAPHPGDPGHGGGARTVVGDCVYTASRETEVRETPCAPRAGKRAPEFKVVRRVAERAACPADTALYVDLGGAKPVGCARRV
ncbi:hypothetical protein [Streptomyces sp. NPDC048172]|uniref:hypothetical protein n=1 Tax=Streptomyces sp. NPDC048172 TaxID=3365505 RepID=UPI00371738FE